MPQEASEFQASSAGQLSKYPLVGTASTSIGSSANDVLPACSKLSPRLFTGRCLSLKVRPPGPVLVSWNPRSSAWCRRQSFGLGAAARRARQKE